MSSRRLLGAHLAGGVKQVDRLLSNQGVNVWTFFAYWTPYIVGARTEVVVALDWTSFAATPGCPRWRYYCALCRPCVDTIMAAARAERERRQAERERADRRRRGNAARQRRWRARHPQRAAAHLRALLGVHKYGNPYPVTHQAAGRRTAAAPFPPPDSVPALAPSRTLPALAHLGALPATWGSGTWPAIHCVGIND